MLGKVMRIVTLCTLACAICSGGRKAEEEKTSRTVPSQTSTKGSSTSRWLAKSLVLGASVHSTSGFGQPALGSSVHAASGFRRPAGVRALEPLKGWGHDTINDRVFNPIKARRAVKRIEAENAQAERIEDVLAAAENVHLFNELEVPGEAWQPNLENRLQGLKKWQLKKLWLGVMAENARAERIEDVLAAAENVLLFNELEAPGEAWQPELENRLQGLKKKQLKRVWLAVMAETAKAERIEDVLVAAWNDHRFNEHDVPWEEWRPKLENDLHGLKKKDLEKLGLGVMVENAKRFAEEEHELMVKWWLRRKLWKVMFGRSKMLSRGAR